MTTVGERTFRGCSNLKEIIVYSNLAEISSNSFAECPSLTDVYYLGSEAEWNNIIIIIENDYEGNVDLLNANIHYINKPQTPQAELSVTETENGYAGTYFPFAVKFKDMPVNAFLQFDSPDNFDEWLSEEYCSNYELFKIPAEEIVFENDEYIYKTSFLIFSSGNENDNFNRKVRVVADIDGIRKYSEFQKFEVRESEERKNNSIGHVYEQTSVPSEDISYPQIIYVDSVKNGNTYRLTITHYTAQDKENVFFYWETDNGEFSGVTENLDTVDLKVSGNATVTVTIGDGYGYIDTKTIEIGG